MDQHDLFADVDFVARLQRLLRSRASSQFPALRRHAEDLVSQSLLDLWRFAARRPELFPQDGRELQGEAGEGIARIAVTILARRAADLYRHDAARWVNESPSQRADEPQADIRSDEPSQQRRALLRQMLEVCIAEIAQLADADRQALWDILGNAGDKAAPRTDAERQRLSRTRKRLAAAIQERLGESARSLLAADLRDE